MLKIEARSPTSTTAEPVLREVRRFQRRHKPFLSNGRITVNNSDEMRRKLRAALAAKPAQVTVDFSEATYIDTSGVATLLEAVRIAREQGTFDRQSVWLIEGLFYYLEEPAVHHVLKEVSGLAAPGSVLVTDLVSQSLLTSPWMQQALKGNGRTGNGLAVWHGRSRRTLRRPWWDTDIKQPGEEGARYDPHRFPNSQDPRWASS